MDSVTCTLLFSKVFHSTYPGSDLGETEGSLKHTVWFSVSLLISIYAYNGSQSGYNVGVSDTGVTYKVQRRTDTVVVPCAEVSKKVCADPCRTAPFYQSLHLALASAILQSSNIIKVYVIKIPNCLLPNPILANASTVIRADGHSGLSARPLIWPIISASNLTYGKFPLA